MSIRNTFSILLSLILCSSPLSALADSAAQITPDQVPAISSLQNLKTLQINGQSLEQGKDYNTDIQYSADHSTAYVCYTFKNGYSGQVVKKHRIGAVDGFSDVEPDYYAADSINYSSDMGWVHGREDGNFYPRDSLSRGELVTILYRLSGQPQEEVNEHFTDIDTTKPGFYTWPALWAAKHGIIKGYTDKYGHVFFRGDNPITRQELAVMLHRYQGEDTSSTSLEGFKDKDSVGSPYLEAMKWCVENGIISGTDGKLNPEGNASRAQAVTMLARFEKAKYQDFPAVSAALARIQSQSNDFLWFEEMPSLASFNAEEKEETVTGILTEPEQNETQETDQDSINETEKDENQDSDTPVSSGPDDLAPNPQEPETDLETDDVTKPGVTYGWNPAGTQFVSFETGEPQTGWLHLNGSTYYLNEQGNLIRNSYERINEKVYNLNEQGQVTPGFVLLDNRAYYFSQYDGHRQEGKKYYDKKEYRLFTLLGEEGFLQDKNGNTVCVFSDGSYAKNEELKVAGNFYYFDGNGNALKNRLVERDGKTYFYAADGKKVIGQALKMGDGNTDYFDFYDGRRVDETEFIAQREAKEVMNQVGTDLYTLFMWIVKNFTFTSDMSHDLSNGEYGRLAFENHRGNCYVFTAAFYYFAYLSGLDPIYVRGEVMYDVPNQLWGDHTWCAIRDEYGKLWYYDPDSERNLGHIVSFWHIDPYHLPAHLRADPDMLP